MTVPAVRVALGLATSSLMVAGTSTSGAGSAAAAPDDRPNVVVIMVDDMSTTEMQYLPKVNALVADEGTMFDEAFNNTPVCCPSRATLLTGQHSRHHGVYTNKPTQGQGYQALDSSNTLATWMTASGYETTFIGKYLNGYGQWGYLPSVPDNREVPPGWSDFQALVGNLKYQDYTINDNGRLVNYGSATEDYQTDVLADRAVASIVDAADSNKPLFLWVAPHSPHTFNGQPPLPAARHRRSFDGIALPRPPNFDEADVSDKPPYVRNQPQITAAVAENMRVHFEARVEALQSVDDLVEDVYEALESTDQLDNTLIVFASDNGYMFGNHRLEGKVRVYDESARVPLAIRGGPFVGGKTITSPVSNADLAPTIVQATGISAGRVMDGADLADVVARPARYADRAILIESVEGPGYSAVRTADWLWVEYEGSSRELYDMRADPYQLTSLHKSSTHAATRQRLGDILDDLRSCSGGNCVVGGPTQPPPPTPTSTTATTTATTAPPSTGGEITVPAAGPDQPSLRIAVTDTAITTRWDPVNGATRYQFRHRIDNQKYKWKTAGNYTTATITPITTNRTYTVEARALISGTWRPWTTGTVTTGGTTPPPTDPTTTATTAPPSPGGEITVPAAGPDQPSLRIAVTDTAITTRWDPVNGATRYQFRHRIDNQKYTWKTAGNYTTATITPITTNRTYTIEARALISGTWRPWTTGTVTTGG